MIIENLKTQYSTLKSSKVLAELWLKEPSVAFYDDLWAVLGACGVEPREKWEQKPNTHISNQKRASTN